MPDPLEGHRQFPDPSTSLHARFTTIPRLYGPRPPHRPPRKHPIMAPIHFPFFFSRRPVHGRSPATRISSTLRPGHKCPPRNSKPSPADADRRRKDPVAHRAHSTDCNTNSHPIRQDQNQVEPHSSHLPDFENGDRKFGTERGVRFVEGDAIGASQC